jgi:hypothetical protein
MFTFFFHQRIVSNRKNKLLVSGKISSVELNKLALAIAHVSKMYCWQKVKTLLLLKKSPLNEISYIEDTASYLS